MLKKFRLICECHYSSIVNVHQRERGGKNQWSILIGCFCLYGQSSKNHLLPSPHQAWNLSIRLTKHQVFIGLCSYTVLSRYLTWIRTASEMRNHLSFRFLSQEAPPVYLRLTPLTILTYVGGCDNDSVSGYAKMVKGQSMRKIFLPHFKVNTMMNKNIYQLLLLDWNEIKWMK